MNLTCRFHVGLADSWHFQGTFPMSLSRHFHVTFMANPNMAKGESTKKVPWICHESVMKLFGEPCSGLKWKSQESDMKVPWKRHESAMKVPWVWYEYDMPMIQWIWTIFHSRFMALSWHFPLKNSKIVEIHHIIFISYSCRFHATFMALSWYFQPNRAPNSFMPFSWHFSWKLFQDCHNWLYHVCVCLSVVSVSFLLLIFFHWWFFRLINVFLFSLIKI